jgi:[ribosomal protein S5]-alanine N-acetyltransferase
MTDLTLLETDRLVLSGWRADQIDDLYRLHGDPAVARYLTGHGQPWSKSVMDTALAHWIDLFERQKMGKLRVTRKADGVLVGRCGFGVYGPDETPEIGYSLYPEFWGNGYIWEAASALRDWYWRDTDRDHFLGMADARNTASLKVLRKLGGVYMHTGDSHDHPNVEFYRYDRPMA